jgi:hypothetical protein
MRAECWDNIRPVRDINLPHALAALSFLAGIQPERFPVGVEPLYRESDFPSSSVARARQSIERACCQVVKGRMSVAECEQIVARCEAAIAALEP